MADGKKPALGPASPPERWAGPKRKDMERLRTCMGMTVLCVALFACQAQPVLWIVPGSTVDNLVIGVSEEKGIEKPILVEGVYVYKGPYPYDLDSDWYIYPVWAVVMNGKKTISPLYRIKYGETPNDFSLIIKAQALDVNFKYKAWVHFRYSNNKIGAAPIKFLFSKKGQAKEFNLD